jgi:hypothetical protein
VVDELRQSKEVQHFIKTVTSQMDEQDVDIIIKQFHSRPTKHSHQKSSIKYRTKGSDQQFRLETPAINMKTIEAGELLVRTSIYDEGMVSAMEAKSKVYGFERRNPNAGREVELTTEQLIHL